MGAESGLYINNVPSRSLTFSDKPVHITIGIPEELRADEYVIIRVHNGSSASMSGAVYTKRRAR